MYSFPSFEGAVEYTVCISVLDMTLNHLIARLQPQSFGE